jgi:hypothetical protein
MSNNKQRCELEEGCEWKRRCEMDRRCELEPRVRALRSQTSAPQLDVLPDGVAEAEGSKSTMGARCAASPNPASHLIHVSIMSRTGTSTGGGGGTCGRPRGGRRPGGGGVRASARARARAGAWAWAWGRARRGGRTSCVLRQLCRGRLTLGLGHGGWWRLSPSGLGLYASAGRKLYHGRPNEARSDGGTQRLLSERAASLVRASSGFAEMACDHRAQHRSGMDKAGHGAGNRSGTA